MFSLTRLSFRSTTLHAVTAALIATAAAPVLAQDLRQDDWSFNLFNDSSIALRSFQTADKSGNYGHNWLEGAMLPGIGLTMEFTDPLDTRCEVPTMITFTNGAVLEYLVDYCGTAIVRVTNTGFFVE
jgi:hypothetical protein